jgi:hypothetical protein
MPLLHDGTPSCSGSQFTPRSTISSGHFLWLSVSPCSQLPAPTPLLPSSLWDLP